MKRPKGAKKVRVKSPVHERDPREPHRPTPAEAAEERRRELDIKIAYAAQEQVVHGERKKKKYKLPLPTPMSLGPFKRAFDEFAKVAAAGDEASVLIGIGTLVWILENQTADDFDPRSIPADVGIKRARELGWSDVAVYRELLVEVADRLKEVVTF